jgi:betaine-aldehyde dehydrogenase
VSNYIRSGLEEGAHAAIGAVPRDDAEGYFVEPTVLVDVKPQMKVWREEIFGPVLSVMRYTDIDTALRLANDTEFGLGAAVMTRDEALGRRISRALEAGVVWVNCSQPTFCTLPFGGYKQSGIGRECGTMGLDGYLETKQVSTWVDPKTTGWGWFV